MSYDQRIDDILGAIHRDWPTEGAPPSGGLAIQSALSLDGRYVTGLALTRPPTKAPATDLDTRFRIASISKPITSAAVLLLVEQGRLRLEDTLYDLVYHDDEPQRRPAELAAIQHVTIDEISRASWQLIVPNKPFAYSNFTYCLMGRIVAKVTASYEKFVQKNILRKAGTSSTGRDDQPCRIPALPTAKGSDYGRSRRAAVTYVTAMVLRR